MADNWEDKAVPKIKSWEDEEDDVADAWDAEPEEVEEVVVVTKTKVVKRPVIVKEMTAEEQRLAQERADLGHTMDLFGIEPATLIKPEQLETKESIKECSQQLGDQLCAVDKEKLYPDFLAQLFEVACTNLASDQMRKLSNLMRGLADIRGTEEKKLKDAKKPGKSKGKIKHEKNTIMGDYNQFLKDSTSGPVVQVGIEDLDEDDFM